MTCTVHQASIKMGGAHGLPYIDYIYSLVQYTTLIRMAYKPRIVENGATSAIVPLMSCDSADDFIDLKKINKLLSIVNKLRVSWYCTEM